MSLASVTLYVRDKLTVTVDCGVIAFSLNN